MSGLLASWDGRNGPIEQRALKVNHSEAITNCYRGGAIFYEMDNFAIPEVVATGEVDGDRSENDSLLDFRDSSLVFVLLARWARPRSDTENY